jgi:hypothetical protein
VRKKQQDIYKQLYVVNTKDGRVHETALPPAQRQALMKQYESLGKLYDSLSDELRHLGMTKQQDGTWVPQAPPPRGRSVYDGYQSTVPVPTSSPTQVLQQYGIGPQGNLPAPRAAGR